MKETLIKIGFNEWLQSLESAPYPVMFWDIPKFIQSAYIQKYLREVHDIYVESFHDYDPKDGTYQYYTNWGYNNPDTIEKKQSGWFDEYNDWKVYEDALEFGLQEAVKMIKISAKKNENNS